MQKLRSQVQSLSDTHLMIQQFNSHADNLSQRSREIEALIVAQNVRIAQNENAMEPEKCDCSATTLSTTTTTCDDSDKDYVNIVMARQIITDEVLKECKAKIQEVHNVYDAKMKVYGDECNKQCDQATAALEAGKAASNLDRRINYASRRAGASIVHHQTSATWAPPQAADPAKRLVMWAKDEEGWLQSVAQRITSKRVEDIVDLSRLESTVRGVMDLLGAGGKSGVGEPEDALSADMTLGSCWPLDKGTGHLTIKLAQPVSISSVVIDHIPRNEALDVRSAPKNFRVSALDDPREASSNGGLILEGTYSIDSGSPASQVFTADTPSGLVQYIRLEVLSNHEHPYFTCLYRLRVYGQHE